ncbi:MAG: FHA domain-containing protein [Planctomycetaceae bacterium]|nr:FHA domain-containing protein [Planctomycetaceae bacterium]
MHSLIVETGKHKGKKLKLPDGECVIGRDEAAQIRIASEEVSRTHCAIVAAGDRIVVRDLGSRNGTFINGRAITEETEFKPGDLLVIGPMGFRRPQAAVTTESGRAGSKGIAKPDQQKLSDDDIASWLSIGSGDATSDSDTAVIEVGDAQQVAEPIVPPPKKVFRSTAEEAADIIRRHRESLNSSE